MITPESSNIDINPENLRIARDVVLELWSNDADNENLRSTFGLLARLLIAHENE